MQSRGKETQARGMSTGEQQIRASRSSSALLHHSPETTAGRRAAIFHPYPPLLRMPSPHPMTTTAIRSPRGYLSRFPTLRILNGSLCPQELIEWAEKATELIFCVGVPSPQLWLAGPAAIH
ncbi:hypothetical protein MUK42_27364 [Musa troglodytarum]|uniref:Uncharacterized protein n=1 Tax=Musa troglodytarum TaxID=320322 RepID=A0A9E7F1S3_9LILI|nr:hypothetical protein MUK42_27364 [Musa troglodytarum]